MGYPQSFCRPDQPVLFRIHSTKTISIIRGRHVRGPALSVRIPAIRRLHLCGAHKGKFRASCRLSRTDLTHLRRFSIRYRGNEGMPLSECRGVLGRWSRPAIDHSLPDPA